MIHYNKDNTVCCYFVTVLLLCLYDKSSVVQTWAKCFQSETSAHIYQQSSARHENRCCANKPAVSDCEGKGDLGWRKGTFYFWAILLTLPFQLQFYLFISNDMKYFVVSLVLRQAFILKITPCWKLENLYSDIRIYLK